MSAGAALGVAVVGLGIGEQHARVYAGLPECTLRWLHDLDANRAAKVAAMLQQGCPAERFETILADSAVDLVSVASYDDAHATQVLAALEAGKHVFVEKPLCRSLDDLRAIKAAWAANDRHLASNLVLRAAPFYLALRSMIETGELGEVYAFDGDYLYGRMEKITEGWRKDVAAYSVMQGGGIHLVDLMLWLTGQRPVAVTAAGNRIATANTAFRYPDYVAATFRFTAGSIGRITANFGCVHRHQHVVRVFGTRGSVIYDDTGARWHRGREPHDTVERVELSALPPDKGALIPPFVQAIRAGKGMSAETQHELDVVSACLAADRALATGEQVEVTYV